MQKYIILSIVASCLLMSCNSINNKNLSQGKEVLTLFPLEKYDQNVSTWLNPDDPNYNTPLLAADTQQRHFKLFYEHKYGKLSPWDQNFVNLVLHKASPEDIISIQEEIVSKYSNRGKKAEDDIGYAENYRPYSPAWADQITYNMNIAQFANLDYNPNNRAIAIDNLHARALPTNDVHFYSNKIAGQGYPFDNLQETAIWVGTPLYVVGTTMDKNWSLVIAPSSFLTWVESRGIAKASSRFIDNWQKAAKLKLGAITQTNTNIIDLNGRSLFTAYIGSVFPIVDSKDTSNKKLMIPVVENNRAIIKHVSVPNENVEIMPLSFTQHNMANLMSSLIGRPCGWGNMYFYNDCSAELKNLFTPFGVWLPRNSGAQAEFIKENFYAIDMSAATSLERLSYLMKNGKPFLTIIHIEGHVFLYIGNYPNVHNKESTLMAMTYQNIWGLRPKNENSRIVIGGSLFLPLLLEYPEAPKAQSLADKKRFEILYLTD
ncbi:MAG TPA: SH3 domain-containing protein [Rickettsia endosymbiont of Bembidion nr. Transversale]|nr:SH3 domain-containing protein [Rickettsia endosymbiont of Bembidion nr. Transversale]